MNYYTPRKYSPTVNFFLYYTEKMFCLAEKRSEKKILDISFL